MSLHNQSLGVDKEYLMEIEFAVKIDVVTGEGCSRLDWIDKFTQEIKHEYPYSEVRVVK